MYVSTKFFFTVYRDFLIITRYLWKSMKSVLGDIIGYTRTMLDKYNKIIFYLMY